MYLKCLCWVLLECSLCITNGCINRGHSLDLRTVLLSISGLYLGVIPTVVAMLFMGIYRVIIGGDFMVLGLLLIVSSGILGIGWRYFLPKGTKPNSILSLYVLGIVTHAVMVFWLVLLPKEDFLGLFQLLVFPILVLYPFITMILGILMSRQHTNWENEKAKDRFIESEQRNEIYYQWNNRNWQQR